MLSVNKPLMEQAFANMLVKNGVFYNAAYNAYYKCIEYSHEKASADLLGINNTAAGADPMDLTPNKEEWKKMSDIFASNFIKGLKDGNFDSTLANEIDKHVKSTELMITMMPQGIATIVSPMGPCTGSMIISSSTANIQLL